MAMVPAGLAEYQRRHARARSVQFYAVIAVSIACGFAVAELWVYLAGVALGAAMMVGGWEIGAQIAKARMIRQFPELADPRIHWRRY
jgi:hypothetical protein